MNKITPFELQGSNGKFDEIGTAGLQAWSGYLQQAYHSELRWPEVYPLFERIRRSDPEISIVRVIFGTLGRSMSIEWDLPEDPSDDDRKAQEFGYSVFEDMEGGIERWRDSLLAVTPFMGWSWWEMVPGLRRENWRPPDKEDPWRSDYNDGMLGVRRLAWRDPSSFSSWDLNDQSGRLRGMNQLDMPNPPVTIPLDQSVHITFGDAESPEGLSPLEAVWRLERLKYGLELVQGIGFEHAAGYLDVVSDKTTLTGEDHERIRKAARSIMSVQEGNYAAWPKGITGDLKDVPFAAAPSLLEAIRYYGLLKLQVYFMSWVAIATTAGAGAYAASQDFSYMTVQIFNAMMDGFVSQLDKQFGARLFEWNADRFPGMTERPHLHAPPIKKTLSLSELGGFIKAFGELFPLGEDDILAIRKESGFLPETLPPVEEQPIEEPLPEEDLNDTGIEAEENEAEETIDEAQDEAGPPEKEMQSRPLTVPANELPLDVTYIAAITDKDIQSALRKFRKWAKDNDPDLAEWLDAEVLPPEEGQT